jgi:glycosyltransferase involved in cell wall biosynthesis
MTADARERGLRILAVLQGSSEGGGGHHQSVNALITLARVAGDRHTVSVLDIGHAHRAAIERAIAEGRLPDLPQVSAPPEPTGVRRRLKRSKSFAARVARTLLQVGDRKDDLAAFIDRQSVDLVYFLHPSELAGRLQRRNLITTVWDLCHLDFPEFPEVRTGGEFETRERILRSHVNRAVAVVVDSEASARRMERNYGVDPDRLLVMPFSPSPALDSPDVRPTDEVLVRHGLEAGYLFYPAQFWPHKNHVRLIEALVLRRDAGASDRVVFAGADKGNLKHVMATAERLGVADRIAVLGYVDDLDLRGLYLGARAVVIPTYFGPTNLPPLEAWATERPLLYPQHLKDQVGDAALLFDVDDAHSLTAALDHLEGIGEVRRLSTAGEDALRRWREAQSQAEAQLGMVLERTECRVETVRPGA